MAAEAVVGFALGALFNFLTDRITSEKLVDFFTIQKLDVKLLKKLKRSLKSVRDVLDDAEEKEISKPAIKEWLDDLKSALFEADDLLDDIDYEATRLELEAESRSLVDKVRRLLRPRESFTKGLKARLMEILENIEDLKEEKDALNLIENTGGGESTQRTRTAFFVETSNFVGRERDQEVIMEALLSDDVNRSNNLSIISIVGLGGIGKTALARRIVDENVEVQKRFAVRGWVNVSENFDVPRITTDIAENVAQIACEHKTLIQIEAELTQKLSETMFLLVLDDAWSESSTDWDILLKPLKSGRGGSKIIITTRNDRVAKTVSSKPIVNLNVLAPTECWQLFRKYAFDDPNCQDYPHLEKIGQKIVEKCDGLPLAVKVMGSVLRYNLDAKYWERVLNNDLWKYSKADILPVLRLSYRYLPSHLKQCFAYCSIFPKDYMFKKEQLILLWMAEGFLIEKGTKMEKMGEEYLEELVSRSFFQHFGDSFVMHDLINDLARDVAGDFCFRFENQEIWRTFERLRHFSFELVEEESSWQLSTIFKSHALRTFLPVYDSEWKQQEEKLQKMISDFLLNHQQLRVLSLSPFQNLVELPSSISRLTHLRYLDLSQTSIKSLPKSLCSFYNLQTLKLRRCKNLAKLPTKMGRLINMRYLDIEETKVQRMPPNMGKLIKLQTLANFFVGKRKGCGVKELGSLQHLSGKLRIHNLQNVVNAKDALEAKIKYKKNLKELYLCWKGNKDNPRHEKAVLDGLQPHTEIEVISIDGYGGISFPNWLESGAFPCLKELWVSNCRNLKGAPRGHFPSLAMFAIDRCAQLKNCVPLPEAAPNLSSLVLVNEDCSLCYHPNDLLIDGLQEPVLENIGQLGSSLEEITITIKHEPLKCFPLGLFPKLKSLRIEHCPNFESLFTPNQEFVPFEFLTQLTLMGCPKLNFLPERMHSLLHGLLNLEIISCPEIKTFPIDGLPVKLQSLTICNCNKLIAGRLNWDLQKLTTLTSFSIMNYYVDEMECFPEVTLLPSTLTSLEICSLKYLKFLNYEGLQRSNSLAKLKIVDCPRLQIVPGEGLLSTLRFHDLTSLRELLIFKCPKIASLPEEELPPNLIDFSLHNP